MSLDMNELDIIEYNQISQRKIKTLAVSVEVKGHMKNYTGEF